MSGTSDNPGAAPIFRGQACRHALTGEVRGQVCEQAFECGSCELHGRLARKAPAPVSARLYHRGHTWVRRAADGSLLIGPDEVATRLIGPFEKAETPAAGARLRANAPAFTIVKNGVALRMLAPLDGTVVESGDGKEGWFSRVVPDAGYSDAPLLRGYEATAWFQVEVERLQLAASDPGAMQALADGGVLVDDVSAVLPQELWEAACAEILLNS